jgi:hypothetical protein
LEVDENNGMTDLSMKLDYLIHRIVNTAMDKEFALRFQNKQNLKADYSFTMHRLSQPALLSEHSADSEKYLENSKSRLTRR